MNRLLAEVFYLLMTLPIFAIVLLAVCFLLAVVFAPTVGEAIHRWEWRRS